LRNKGIYIDEIPGLNNLSLFEAKSVEQVLIDYYKLPNQKNKINSISPLNPRYKDSVVKGRDLLNNAGYIGF
jgi:hypothetical protein